MGLYRGYVGIMEKKKENTIWGLGVGFRASSLGIRALGLRVWGLPKGCSTGLYF